MAEELVQMDEEEGGIVEEGGGEGEVAVEMAGVEGEQDGEYNARPLATTNLKELDLFEKKAEDVPKNDVEDGPGEFEDPSGQAFLPGTWQREPGEKSKKGEKAKDCSLDGTSFNVFKNHRRFVTLNNIGTKEAADEARASPRPATTSLQTRAALPSPPPPLSPLCDPPPPPRRRAP